MMIRNNESFHMMIFTSIMNYSENLSGDLGLKSAMQGHLFKSKCMNRGREQNDKGYS